MSETQIEAESAQGAKKPSPETLLDAAVLSSAMYNLLSPKKPELNGYKIHHFEFGDKSNFRITNWCIFAKEKMTIERKKSIRLFIVVRGSQSAIDWLVNFSFIPAAHPTYKFVEVHSGYAAEVAREYGLIKQWLISFFENHNADDVVDVVISGHSKGGGLAQLIIDKFYNDDVFKSTYRQIFMKMTCVTFAAPFVYWFPDLTMVENVKSGHLLHNYVIRGDPVPVLQLLLKDSDAFLSLVKKEISFIGIPAIEFLGVKDKVEEIAPLLEGFAPIGKIYSATLSSSSSAKSFGKTFVRSEYKYDSLDDWDCVNHNSFGSAYHDISNHIMVADSKSDQDGVLKFGLYVRNATQSDVWIIMTGFHLFYCQCVPPGKVHIGSTWSKYLTVSISALNHEPGFTDGLRQVCAFFSFMQLFKNKCCSELWTWGNIYMHRLCYCWLFFVHFLWRNIIRPLM